MIDRGCYLNKLVTLLATLLICGSLSAKDLQQNTEVKTSTPIMIDLASAKKLLESHRDTLSDELIQSALSVIDCANKHQSVYSQYLTLIDYSLPSYQKRLWVFDIGKQQLLFHTLVSHGINSGVLTPSFFSNKNKSKASSLGVFQTLNSYNGRYGLGLRLEGLEKSINDNAYDRAIVVHPAWYVSDDFIRKYGRIGRSWGCPALSPDMIEPVINAIKDNSLMVVYYPSQKWSKRSKFLSCESHTTGLKGFEPSTPITATDRPDRDAVLFIDANNNNKRDDKEPVVVMSAENYKTIYNKPVPLTRMLRRQVNNQEYIALSPVELEALEQNARFTKRDTQGHVLDLFVAQVKKKGIFLATEFKSVKEVFDVDFRLSNSKSPLKPTKKFIRWLGL